MQKLIQFYQSLPSWLKNKYFITSVVYLLWILFFNDYNLIFQWQKSKELADLKDKKTYFIKEIAQVNQDKKDLFSNTESLEKFAREKYYMKKDNEDIYLIEEK
ncbi:MAG: septum formation initiator family protein [Bacteroidota bacterium]